VNSRNFSPLTVWKHVRRKSAVSRTSSPESWFRTACEVEGAEGLGPLGGTGTEEEFADEELDWGEGLCADGGSEAASWDVMALGVRERVMACTPWNVPARTSASLLESVANAGVNVWL